MFVYGSLRARVLTVVGLTLVPSFVVFAVLHPMSVERNAADTVLRLLGGGMLSLAVAWVSTSSMITRPAERVVLAARRLRDGDVTARASFRDHSEIGEMARTFDELADALRAREQQLETLNAELEERVTHRSAALERANGELSLSRTELRRLSHELLEIVEKERLRLSPEVHDQIGQVLTGIKMDVAAARRRLDAADVPGARQRLDTAMETVDEAVHLARQIALNLRPSLLDDCGLTAAAECQLEEFGRRTGILCRLSSDMDDDLIRPQLGTAAYRIIEEALTNIARHADASTVDVRLVTDATHLTLTVSDDGRGITERELAGQRSLGLLGMRERTLQVGGTISVVGSAGQGTVVTTMLPLAHPDPVDSQEDHRDASPDR